ncbi:hypothetical protein DFH08DRAFT_993322 [Mycena albidolilacea]|uniref:CxC5 like cysteine cluster associated with KDZ domain-containing protein n=1 Tax=Mycena albidolilacea TaxID=1033008 RepID=A0AAD7A802_9AGAR|nr:hypothetical protein DFH08DRAFT_993322 [Mycena albidolilacea]
MLLGSILKLPTPSLMLMLFSTSNSLHSSNRHQLWPTSSRLINHLVPLTLPANVHEFLKACFGVADETAKLAWAIFGDLAWAFEPSSDDLKAYRIKHVKLLLQYGLDNQIELGEPKNHRITIFTLELGAMPGYSTSLYCRNCHTRYYPNYYVHESATMRTYYLHPGVPEFIQSAEHFYTGTDLCELFSNMMVTAWTSATNCARIYNTSISKDALQPYLPSNWLSFEMDIEDVLNSFFLNALLLDHQERRHPLELRHDAPSSTERLCPALEARNIRMAGPGQEECICKLMWNHVCSLCCYIYGDSDGRWLYLRSTITDGLTMGHYCCLIADCQNRLRSVKDLFCFEHQPLKNHAAVQTGFRTCRLPEHRNMELYHYQRGKAMFQLRDRLQRAKGFAPSSSFPAPSPDTPNATSSRLPPLRKETEATGADLLPMPDGPATSTAHSDDNDDDDEIEFACEGKSTEGNRVLRARFGRRWTHNEQLCVFSCGVVAGRATFFGSEAPNGVREFWMKLFPTQASLPGVLWHDNNCSIVKMLRNDTDDYLRTYFDNVALPVDVFHFKSKHKESDIDCGANCNPYIWPGLRTEDGKWRFNSSAAEQTNAWFGGFLAIVREMPVERFNFFLDEMIKRRNQILVRDLRKRGKAPGNIPREILLADDEGSEMNIT